MKGDSGSYAVSTEHGSFFDVTVASCQSSGVISRLPGRAGQASDAVSAYTEVKMKDAPKLFKTTGNGTSNHSNSFTTIAPPEIMRRNSSSCVYHSKDIFTDTHRGNDNSKRF